MIIIIPHVVPSKNYAVGVIMIMDHTAACGSRHNIGEERSNDYTTQVVGKGICREVALRPGEGHIPVVIDPKTVVNMAEDRHTERH